jgi:hypothetical protein
LEPGLNANELLVTAEDPRFRTSYTLLITFIRLAPAVETQPATHMATNPATGGMSVQLNSAVNPYGLDAMVWFDYGLSPAYGGTTPLLGIPGDFNLLPLAAPVSGLLPGPAYHCRAAASNSVGVAYGGDMTITFAGRYISGDLNGDRVVDQTELNTVLSNYWPHSPWLYMTDTAGLGSTNVTFALTNASAWNFSVLMSTNLLDWDYLGLATPLYQFFDTNAPAVPQRYYRLRWP